MGQISVEITDPPGSLLNENQQAAHGDGFDEQTPIHSRHWRQYRCLLIWHPLFQG
jgi:hypothetical protein